LHIGAPGGKEAEGGTPGVIREVRRAAALWTAANESVCNGWHVRL